MKNICLGCSGWHYAHWRGIFYKQGADLLTQYARFFQSVEVNSTFYRFPIITQLQKWNVLTPSDFIFSIKMNRHITHTKRLHDVQRPLSDFLSICSVLDQKLGPILIQLPANFEKNVRRLEEFIGLLPNLRFALEFRNETWYSDDVFRLIRGVGNVAIVALGAQFTDSPKDNADFTYIRWHGRGGALDNYSDQEISYWAHKILQLSQKKDVFGYWNNDVKGYAPTNCLELKRKIEANM